MGPAGYQNLPGWVQTTSCLCVRFHQLLDLIRSSANGTSVSHLGQQKCDVLAPERLLTPHLCSKEDEIHLEHC